MRYSLEKGKIHATVTYALKHVKSNFQLIGKRIQRDSITSCVKPTSKLFTFLVSSAAGMYKLKGP